MTATLNTIVQALRLEGEDIISLELRPTEGQ